MKLRNLLILTILTICFSTFQTFACLQVNGSPVIGKRVKIEGVTADAFMRTFVTHEDRAYWENLRAEIESQRKAFPKYEWRNNLAVVMVHLGQVQEAIKLLEELEETSQRNYFSAANLGTAYELNGENQKALDWIKEGIKRNKDSHRGTEWLHVKILDAKLAIEKDADWLKNNSVLGAEFFVAPENLSKIHTTDFLGQQKSLAEIEDALIYQLHERLEFVKPPEPVVADLLFDLSKVFAISRTPEHAKAINELAVNYAANSKELAARRNLEQNKSAETGKQNYYYYAIPAIAALSLIGLIYIFFRKRNLR